MKDTKKNEKIKLTDEEKNSLFYSLKGEEKPIEKKVSIVFDGSQYTVRIPKAMAEAAQIDPKKDCMSARLDMDKRLELILVKG